MWENYLSDKEEVMNTWRINALKQFFSINFVQRYRGAKFFCFREKGIKLDEGNAIFTDLTCYNQLLVGEWCHIDRFYYSSRSNYEERPELGIGLKKVQDKPRIILAFFEVQGAITHSHDKCRVKRIYCATGVEKWSPTGPLGDYPLADNEALHLEEHIIGSHSELRCIHIDSLLEHGLLHVKLFPVDLLVSNILNKV